jgi:hypothetical protein
VKGDSPKTASGAALQPGLLVAFKKDEHTELGLVLQPDGKKNWVIANEVSLQPACSHFTSVYTAFKVAADTAVPDHVDS